MCRKPFATALILACLATAVPAFAGTADELVSAVRAGDTPAIAALLKRKVDPSAAVADGSTPLHWAVDRQNPDVVKMLLAAGARTDAVDIDGATPLIVACQLADQSIIGMLLDAKADVKAVRPDGVDVLSSCVGAATPSTIERLLALGAEADRAAPGGQTPLMRAAYYGRLETAALLVKHGAKVNAATEKGFTPLFFALKSDSPEAAPAIAALGGDTKHVAADGTTALQLALYQNKLAFATRLINEGADITLFDQNGYQPLHVAAEKGDVAMVRALLARGANPNGLSVKSRLDWRVESARGGTLPIVPFVPPLYLAAKAGSAEIMKMLVAAGGRTDIRTERSESYIMAAAESGDLAALEYALTFDKDIDGLNLDKRTAMHVILVNAQQSPLLGDAPAMLRTLLDHGAATDIRDRRGQTVAEMAATSSERVKAMFAELMASRQPKALASAN